MKRHILMATITLISVATCLTLLARQQQPATPQPAAQPTTQPLKIGMIDSRLFDDENGIQQLVQQARRTQDSFKDEIARLQRVQQEIQTEQQDLRTQWDRLPPQVRQDRQEKLEIRQRQFQRDSEDLQRNVDAALRKAVEPVQERIVSHLAAYAQARNLSLVFDQAVLSQAGALPYFNPTLDVTRDFINDYNRANPAR